MKKLLVIFLGIFAIFGIVSCGNDNPTEIEYNLNEQLDVPSNLVVNEITKTLTWDEVENAVRYNVYVDGELEDEVTTTSFDFSGLTGNKLMFTVKAMAPKGMQNSNVSTTIAFVANRESEISEMKLSLQSSGMTFNDEDAFATELVNKGMLSEDFDTMMTEMEEMEAIGDMTDVSDIYNEFDQMIATMDMAMIEAFISSLIKVELRGMLQTQIDEYEPGYYPEYDNMEQAEDLVEFIDNEGDEAVKSAMIVIEYLVEVQDGIDTDLVANIETLVNADQMTASNITMLVNVKNDLINNLKDNLPELQDVIVLNSTLIAFMQVSGDNSIDTSVLSVPKQSAQSLMSMELFFNYMLEIDEDYMSALVDASESNSPMDSKAFVKENIGLMDQFLDNNDVLIQQMNNIYTDEEKEEVFYDYYFEAVLGNYYTMVFGGMRSEVDDDIKTIIEEQISFDNILLLQASMDETFNDLLDAIIESDYAIVDAFYDVTEFSNEITGSQAVGNLIKEMVALMNPILQGTTVEEYTAMIDLIFGQLIVQYEIQADVMSDYNGIDFNEIIDVMGYYETGFKNTATNQLNIMKDLVDLLDQTNYIDDFIELADTADQSGESDEYYGAMVLLANAYLDFYVDSQADIDAMIEELMTILNEPDVRIYMQLTSSDIEEIDSTISSYFTDLTEQANIIKNYDYNNLTNTQKANIDAFVSAMLALTIVIA